MNRQLYWVAIRGPLVDEATMRRAVVVIGAPGGQALWLFGEDPNDSKAIGPMIGPSNYEFLIGYQSRAAQQAGIAKLLHAPIDEARAEVRRTFREETVILGKGWYQQ